MVGRLSLAVSRGCLRFVIVIFPDHTHYFRGFVNNKGADQPAHPRSLISAFVIRLLESFISKLATREISLF